MLYMLMLTGSEADYESVTEDAMAAEMEAYADFDRRHAEVIRSSEALQPIATATTVRVRDGERMLTDGPFAETREQIGGYYVVDVADLDQALELAAQIPAARTGSIEVRPVLTLDEAES